MDEHKVGDVFQILPIHGRAGWIGAFVTATEIRSWGVIGFVFSLGTHEQSGRAYIRLKWEELAYIGQAVLMPQDAVIETKPC